MPKESILVLSKSPLSSNTPNHLGEKTFLMFQHKGPGCCSMRVSAVQQYTPGECTLFRLAHNLSMSITPSHCACRILTLNKVILFHFPIVYCENENTRASAFSQLCHQCWSKSHGCPVPPSLFGQSSTNISAHKEGESLLKGETREKTWALLSTLLCNISVILVVKYRFHLVGQLTRLCWALLAPLGSRPGENSSSSEECISQAGCPSRTANLSKRNGYFCWDWVQSTEDPALQSTICQDRRQLRREDNFEIETVDR